MIELQPTSIVFDYFDHKYLNDDLIRKALRKNVYLIKHFWRDSEELCIFAASLNPYSIIDMPPERRTIEVLKAAYCKDKELISELQRTDPEAEVVLKSRKCILEYMTNKERESIGVIGWKSKRKSKK